MWNLRLKWFYFSSGLFSLSSDARYTHTESYSRFLQNYDRLRNVLWREVCMGPESVAEEVQRQAVSVRQMSFAAFMQAGKRIECENARRLQLTCVTNPLPSYRPQSADADRAPLIFKPLVRLQISTPLHCG